MAQLLDETDDGALPQTKFMHTHSYVANTYKFDTNKYLERYNHMKATTDNKIEEVSNFKLFVSAYFYHPYYIPGKWHKLNKGKKAKTDIPPETFFLSCTKALAENP